MWHAMPDARVGLNSTPDHQFQEDQGSVLWTVTELKNTFHTSPIMSRNSHKKHHLERSTV